MTNYAPSLPGLRGDNTLFDPEENPPLEIQLQEASFNAGDRKFFTEEFRSLQETTMVKFPPSQLRTLERTFGVFSSHSTTFGHPLRWHLKATWKPEERILEQFQALDQWHNWLVRNGLQPYSLNWKQFHLAYWLSREKFPLPFGEAGFRELHRSLKVQSFRELASQQLFYQVASGRVTSFVGSPAEDGRTKLVVSFRLPVRLEAFSPVVFALHSTAQESVLRNTKIRKIVLVRPHQQFPGTQLPDSEWLVLVTFNA